MGQGNLKVDVKTANGTLPVPGANVTISDAGGNVLYRLITDADGETESVSLQAPDASTTLQPGGEAYATYNVTISKDGYITENIVGAEVLDKISQTQPVNMKPAYAGSDSSETINIPDNALKQTPPQIGQTAALRPASRVLRDVIIPSNITVHMGTPTNTSAKNITVSFPDYVKNVVASEIYATWPQASLEANTRAIISLALNRIYTEWYRSRGYNFDITNSTQYDQYYKEGQTIPDNISQLVDRIYNEYIRRTGFREPLFSSYCNGTTATCPGMSQWGSVSLANAGNSALNILKHYYGDNIEIAKTNNISGVLTSYPGYTLSQGSMNESVAQMQTYLNRIATNYPAIPKDTPDGRFDTTTAASVREFQKIFGLPQTGLIDQATWNKISYIYVAVTKLAELNSEGERVGIGENPPSSTLRQGSAGADVLQLQFILNAVGMYYNSIPSLVEDGSFGPTTSNAVKAFQQQFGLTADGIVGANTWRKLYEVYRSLDLGDTGGGEPDIPAYPGTLIRVGSRGNDVDMIQSFLNALSDKYPSIPRVVRDGIFGPATQAQVQAYQKIFGLAADGIVGPATWNSIMNAYFYEDAGSEPAPQYPGTLIRQGSVGEDVRTLQEYLNKLANQNSSVPHIDVDGIFGPGTKAAVVAAQNALGLAADGIVGPATWGAVVK